MIITPNKFALIIENTVKNKKMSYMDAIIEYCNNNGIDYSRDINLENEKSMWLVNETQINNR